MEKKYPDNSLLLDRLKKRDEVAWKDYYKDVIKTLLYYAGDFFIGHPQKSDYAKDIVSEAITKLSERIDDFNTITQTKSYLYTLIKNKCIDHLRHFETKQKVHNTILEDPIHSEDIFYEHLTKAELVNAVFDVINNEFDDITTAIFRLHFKEGLNLKEIAEQLDLTVEAVKGRKKRGLEVLKNMPIPIVIAILVTIN
jgi:RNA polymerase sigma factor (sigma-70 family)